MKEDENESKSILSGYNKILIEEFYIFEEFLQRKGIEIPPPDVKGKAFKGLYMGWIYGIIKMYE